MRPAIWLWGTGTVLVQVKQRGCITAAAIRTFIGILECLPLARRNQALQAAARGGGGFSLFPVDPTSARSLPHPSIKRKSVARSFGANKP